MPKPKVKCEVCRGRGWLICTRMDGRRAVERCDACVALCSDEEAAALARAAGVACRPRYPCYVKEPAVDGKSA